jgi:hypothetical protein
VVFERKNKKRNKKLINRKLLKKTTSQVGIGISKEMKMKKTGFSQRVS